MAATALTALGMGPAAPEPMPGAARA
jgi:hypothetical protein